MANCEQCGKRRDPDTGDCPTAGDCARLKAPHKRLAREAASTRDATREAAREHAAISLEPAQVSQALARHSPQEAMRVALASERSRRGWVSGDRAARRGRR